MPAIYRIHPAVGIARLGNSPDGFYIGPEAPAALPTDCDAQGNARLTPDGTQEVPITTFKDAEGRVKRQAARFQVYVYDEESPGGRPLKLGDPVAGGGNQGMLADVQWRVWLGNKKASWYEFRQAEGEHGYAPTHPRRNLNVTGDQARQRLIIDPGPRVVNVSDRRTASFDRDGTDLYATTFPPPLTPHSIDTLGELKTDDQARLLVLGGHGHSGSWNRDQFGQPRIDTYANNDGWFDDTSDGPVMARLVMSSAEVGQNRYVDVEYPAWVVTGYPGYVPEILDMITMDEVVEDVSIRQFATRTELYGQSGTFARPQHVDPNDQAALTMWRAGRLQWNPEYRPWFYRDIWNILFRPDEFSYLSDVLGLSNFPHNQSTRGTFDPEKLGVPPEVNWKAVRKGVARCAAKLRTGELFVETLAPVLDVLEKQARAELRGIAPSDEAGEGDGDSSALPGLLTEDAAASLQASVAAFVAALDVEAPSLQAGAPAEDAATRLSHETRDAAAGAGTLAQPGTGHPGEGAAAEPGTGEGDEEEGGRDLEGYLAALRTAGARPELVAARDELERGVEAIFAGLPGEASSQASGGGRLRARYQGPPGAMSAAPPEDRAAQVYAHLGSQFRTAVRDHLRKLVTGRLLEECRRRQIEANTYDPNRAYRQFLFELLRQPGEENRFFAGGNPDGRTHNLPLMPLLAGDNPISNTLSSKFLRLTDYQYYLLRQWAAGLFYNEKREGWADPDPWWPYAGWVNRTGRDLDRAVLSNVLGGAFCPGGEVGWVMRNPSIYKEPWRIRADPDFYAFQQTAAQANTGGGTALEPEFTSYISVPLSQDNDFDRGLQPGDLTKYMGIPWQADFNECSTQTINVTYLEWNQLYPASDGDTEMLRGERVWETLWWPAHRPMESYEVAGMQGGKPTGYNWTVWARGVPQTNEGDFKMVSEWWRLGFIRRNPWAGPDVRPTMLPPADPPPYISVERTPHKPEDA
jgi:hypothetical protein